MSFGFIRLLDHILGKIFILIVSPLCSLITKFLPARHSDVAKTITILKLHGGGSLLIALPALLGIRAQYQHTTLTLIGTAETQKYAELTGVFDSYVLINSSSPLTLLTSGFKALAASFRNDVFIDLEPHSFLAAVFSPLTLASRRIGLVKAHEFYRARGYTDALYFNLHAPIYIFYDQIAALLKAQPASIAVCQAALRSQADKKQPLLADQPRPAIYVSAFTSSLSPERMMPMPLWVEQIQKKFGAAPVTIILGGGPQEVASANNLASLLKTALPSSSLILACGKRSLRQAIEDIDRADEFWGVDSGPLHIARLLGKRCVSFWGPSNPAYRLRPISQLDETVYYRPIHCSPCVHMSARAPCKGDNQCMKLLFSPDTSALAIRL